MTPGKQMFSIVTGAMIVAVVAGIVFFTGFVQSAHSNPISY